MYGAPKNMSDSVHAFRQEQCSMQRWFIWRYEMKNKPNMTWLRKPQGSLTKWNKHQSSWHKQAGKQCWYWQQRIISTVWEGRPILRRVPGFDPCWCKRVHKVATEEVINDSLYRSIPKIRLFKIVSQQLKPYRSWLKLILELYIGSREVLENCTFLDGRGTSKFVFFFKSR